MSNEQDNKEVKTQDKKEETQGRGFGRGRRGRGARGKNRRGGNKRRDKRNAGKWKPLTQLGRLVNNGTITSLE